MASMIIIIIISSQREGGRLLWCAARRALRFGGALQSKRAHLALWTGGMQSASVPFDWLLVHALASPMGTVLALEVDGRREGKRRS